ncbi:hypothetical protein MRX96_034240 [Rhipicephalus microplus]
MCRQTVSSHSVPASEVGFLAGLRRAALIIIPSDAYTVKCAHKRKFILRQGFQRKGCSPTRRLLVGLPGAYQRSTVDEGFYTYLFTRQDWASCTVRGQLILVGPKKSFLRAALGNQSQKRRASASVARHSTNWHVQTVGGPRSEHNHAQLRRALSTSASGAKTKSACLGPQDELSGVFQRGLSDAGGVCYTMPKPIPVPLFLRANRRSGEFKKSTAVGVRRSRNTGGWKLFEYT